MCASASVSQVLPRDSATIQVLMSMQMDAESKVEQNGPLFCLDGGTGRGVWGVVGPSEGSIQKSGHAFQKEYTLLYK
jgi:hypothetical protein